MRRSPHFLARAASAAITTALADTRRLRERGRTRSSRDVPEIMVMEEMRRPRQTHSSSAAPTTRRRDRSRATRRAACRRSRPISRATASAWRAGSRSPQHPLTARVAVNRAWRMLRPRPRRDAGGLRQPGRLPTHPELLDWLAGAFIDEGWDMKALHRLIVTVARRSAVVRRDRARPCARDPDNQLLARGPEGDGCWRRRSATARSPPAGC